MRVYSKTVSSQCNLPAQIKQVQDIYTLFVYMHTYYQHRISKHVHTTVKNIYMFNNSLIDV